MKKRIFSIFALVIIGIFAFSQTGLGEAEMGKLIKGHYRTGTLELPMNSFLVQSTYAGEEGVILPLSTSTTPGLEYDDYEVAVVWANTEVSPIAVNFTVPSDYASDGYFEVFCMWDGAVATPCAIDFNVFINSHNVAAHAGATNETQVNLATLISMQEVDLVPATEFSVLQPGDRVFFQMWRDNAVNSSTTDLEVRSVRFKYLSVWH